MTALLTRSMCYFSDKNIADDRYLLPYATYEIGMIRLLQNRYDDARDLLKRAK